MEGFALGFSWIYDQRLLREYRTSADEWYYAVIQNPQ